MAHSFQPQFSWCSWSSRQSNTLKVPGSNPGENMQSSGIFTFPSFWLLQWWVRVGQQMGITLCTERELPLPSQRVSCSFDTYLMGGYINFSFQTIQTQEMGTLDLKNLGSKFVYIRFRCLFFGFQFCEVSGMVIILKWAQPKLATGQRGRQNILGFGLCCGDKIDSYLLI